ncbi:MAG: hypothetical protein AAF400_00375 [Bacteroidota bacterium]
MKAKHPYLEYEESSLWRAVQHALNELIENQDLVLQTREEYVIGYICQIVEQRAGERI